MKVQSVPPGALVLALAALGCQPAEPPAAPLSEEDVTAIRAVAESYADAMLAGDVQAVAELFTENGRLMPPNGPTAQGRAEIRRLLAEGPGPVSDFSNPPTEIDGRDDLAYALGTYSISYAPEGMPEPIRDRGKYVVVLRRGADGSWRISALIYNSDLPPPEQG